MKTRIYSVEKEDKTV